MINIIIPTYKARATLPNALDSLVAQTRKMFCVTIVEDCDGENYNDIIEEYRRRGLTIFYLRTPENQGPGMARQLGIDHSHNFEYLMFLDSDDMLMPRAVEVLFQHMKMRKLDIAASNFLQEINNYMPVLKEADKIPVQWCHGKIYRTQYLIDNNIRFDPYLRLNEDSYFNCLAWNLTQAKICIPEVTYIWRDYKGSLTRKESDKNFFLKSYDTFIWAQAHSMIRVLQEVQKIPESQDALASFAAFMLHTIYIQCMTARYYEADCSMLANVFHYLDQQEELFTYLEMPKFWQAINNKQTNMLTIEAPYIYPLTYTFYEWLVTEVITKPLKIVKFKEDQK